MKNKTRGLFVLLCFVAGSVSAGLSEAVEQAWSSSPLLSSQLRGEAELYRISADDVWRRYLPNDPLLQYSKNDSGSAEVFSLVEPFAFPFKSLAFSRWDRARRNAQLAELQAKRYEIARTTVENYLNAAVSRELAEQQKKNIVDTEAVSRSLQARYESGMATQAETIVTDLQLRQQRADLNMMEEKSVVAQARFRQWMGLGVQDPLDLALPDDLDDRLVAEIGDRTADEARAEAAKNVADANRAVSAWSQLPDLNVGVSKNHYLLLEASPNGAKTTRSYTVGITLPFLFPVNQNLEKDRQKNQASIDKANAELQVMSAYEDREEARLEYQRNKARLIELRQKDLPFAEALIDSTLSAYKAGKLGLAELVLARKTLMDLRAQDVQLRGAIISAHVRSLTTTGA